MKIDHLQKPDWTPKVWGRTKCVHQGINFEVHELEIRKGGFCSLHRHRKWNFFHIISGQLRVELHEDPSSSECEASLLSAGDQFKVAPETWHRFVATEDCRVLEIYWTVEISPNDIERFDEGGIMEVLL